MKEDKDGGSGAGTATASSTLGTLVSVLHQERDVTVTSQEDVEDWAQPEERRECSPLSRAEERREETAEVAEAPQEESGSAPHRIATPM